VSSEILVWPQKSTRTTNHGLAPGFAFGYAEASGLARIFAATEDSEGTEVSAWAYSNKPFFEASFCKGLILVRLAVGLPSPGTADRPKVLNEVEQRK